MYIVENKPLVKEENSPVRIEEGDTRFLMIRDLLIGMAVPGGITYGEMIMVGELIKKFDTTEGKLELKDDEYLLLMKVLKSLRFLGYNPYVLDTMKHLEALVAV
jgi:hypothetical protein